MCSAVALMLSSLPFPGYQEFLEKLWNGRIAAFLELIRSASEGSLAIGLALTTCFSYAMQRNRSRRLLCGGGIGCDTGSSGCSIFCRIASSVLAEDLKDAVRGRKLFFLYQPQMNTEGKCIGAEALDKMRRLKEKGHKFLIDDFGMGHTSLVYLQTNYFSVVKLDGSLTKDVMENERNRWL